MDRGFELMIPVKKEEEPKNIYDYTIKFNLMGKQFQFIIKVQNNRRTQ
jgi:hypothetical protein